jgi:hypothetical protein
MEEKDQMFNQNISSRNIAILDLRKKNNPTDLFIGKFLQRKHIEKGFERKKSLKSEFAFLN